MNVLIGATVIWLVLGGILGGAIFLLTKGTLWPFFVVLLGMVLLVKKVACESH